MVVIIPINEMNNKPIFNKFNKENKYNIEIIEDITKIGESFNLMFKYNFKKMIILKTKNKIKKCI